MINWILWENNRVYIEKKLNIIKVVFIFWGKGTERQVYTFILIYKLLQKLKLNFDIYVKVDGIENVCVQHRCGKTLNWTLSQSWRNILLKEMLTGFDSVKTKQKDIEMINALFNNFI